MPGLMAIFRKELADHFTRRFWILFALIFVVSISATYVAAQSIRQDLAGSSAPKFVFLALFTTSSGSLPPFIAFISFLGPLVGLALGFDAINGELNQGTMSRILAQPLFRDSVINGKFLAGLATISIMILSIVCLVSGMGTRLLGIVPLPEEIARLLAFVVVSIIFVGFWMSLAVLFSLFFRQTATSALACIALWIFFTFFVGMIAGVVSEVVVHVDETSTPAVQIQQENVRQALTRASPNTLFQEATVALLAPNVRTFGPVMVREVIGMMPTPLPLSQSLLLVWPQVVSLIALTAIVFAASYSTFLRREIRAF